MTDTHARITAEQPMIHEPWMPEYFIEADDLTPVEGMNLPEVLEELARQLKVMNDFYYPLLAAAGQLRALRVDT
jgi:hypothetical protein